ncbi:hypothetical protein CUU66_21980 [Peribacillus deserti]|uniref:Uncharacterized protein n=1 Tax=Peribacillus deserti TaxID=673318 RepID=A0A2N5M0I2_9BACI|nr:hypothetical protein CUU66_21980 [Peribacillus deserti]
MKLQTYLKLWNSHVSKVLARQKNVANKKMPGPLGNQEIQPFHKVVFANFVVIVIEQGVDWSVRMLAIRVAGPRASSASPVGSPDR